MNTTDILDNSVIATRLRAVKRRLTAAIKQSYLYRWLTAEPEPEVIVIDLRETYTIGPILRLLDRFGAWLGPVVSRSAVGRGSKYLYRALLARPVQLISLVVAVVAVSLLAALVVQGERSLLSFGLVSLIVGGSLLGTRVTLSWAELTDTRGYQLLASVFAPPESSEQISAETVAADESDEEGCSDG